MQPTPKPLKEIYKRDERDWETLGTEANEKKICLDTRIFLVLRRVKLVRIVLEPRFPARVSLMILPTFRPYVPAGALVVDRTKNTVTKRISNLGLSL
jgi:hypothetical protein